MQPERFLGEAAGRVNLIGEHTDYNGGFVLPVAIPQRTRVELRPREGNRVRAASGAISEGREQEFVLGEERRSGGWIDYVQGVTQVLRGRGHALGGCDLAIASDVPIGAGLSSSAALEMALLRAFRAAFGLPLDDVALALLGRQAENEFVGAPVGIMDQMAAALADDRTALFLDTRTLEHERVPLPASLALVVIHSGVAHQHAAGDYRTRRAECDEAAARLGVTQLRDCGPDDLARIDRLPGPLGRRARHVVTENARVLEAVSALKHGDLGRLGELFNASHASMRDDFAVSTAEVDRLVALACDEPEVYGARLTGGGFGGSIVAAVRAGSAATVAPRVASRYRAATNRTPAVGVPVIS
jgi:galactokinase